MSKRLTHPPDVFPLLKDVQMRFPAFIATWLLLSAFPTSSFGQGSGGIAGGILPEFPGHIAFSADGTQLACGAGHKIYIWSVATGKLQQTIDAPARVGPLAWLPGQFQIAAGSFDGNIYLCSTQTGEVSKPIVIDLGIIHHLAISPNGSRMLVACEARDPDVLTVALWDVHRRIVMKTLAREEKSLSGGIAFSPNQTTVAFGINPLKGQSEVRRWHIESGEWSKPYVLPDGQLKSIAYSPDGGHIVCGGWLDQGNGQVQGMISRWSTTDGTLVQAEIFPRLNSMLAIFNPDGESLVGGASFSNSGPNLAGLVAQWSLSKQRTGWKVRMNSHHINAIAFSPDGKLLAFSSSGTRKEMGQLKLIDPQTGEVTASLWTEIESN